MLDEFPVAVDGGVEMAELSEQRALGLGVFEDPGLDGFVFSGCGHSGIGTECHLGISERMLSITDVTVMPAREVLGLMLIQPTSLRRESG